MLSQEFITTIVNGLVVFATDLLLPFMLLVFFCAIALRILVFFTVKRQEWFLKNFETRIFRHFEDNDAKDFKSFFVTIKKNIEKTYYEVFVIRSIMKRRNPDYIMELSDRVFLVRPGCAKLIRDLLHVVKFWKYDQNEPKFEESMAHVIQRNPCFSRVMGIIPLGPLNDILNILPGMFIVGGIFGTFLGIMKALPELGNMDLTDIEGTKAVMDTFLLKISFSMSTSIIGIVLSVTSSMLNTLLNPEKAFLDTITKATRTLELVWNSCENNKVPDDIVEFDEYRDSLEVMAEEAVEKDIENFESSKLNQFLSKEPSIKVGKKKKDQREAVATVDTIPGPPEIVNDKDAPSDDEAA